MAPCDSYSTAAETRMLLISAPYHDTGVLPD